jgi:hypothetical protein
MASKTMTRREAAPIGQAWLLEQLKLQAIAPAHTSYVVQAVRRTEVRDGRTTELYPKQYATDPDPVSNLKFALKHEPFDLTIIVAALKAIGPKPIEEWVRTERASTKRRASSSRATTRSCSPAP